MSQIRYTKDHEWVRLDGASATVGITDHAQAALGDVVFVELPELGREVTAADPIAVVESVKAASDVYAPLSGRVAAVNPQLTADPALVNRDAAGDGWFFKIEIADPADFYGLLDQAAYDTIIKAA